MDMILDQNDELVDLRGFTIFYLEHCTEWKSSVLHQFYTMIKAAVTPGGPLKY